MRFVLIVVLGAILTCGVAAEDGDQTVDGPTDRISYSLGHQIGSDLERQGTEIDPGALRQGLLDGLAGSEPSLDPEDMQRILAMLKRRLQSAGRREDREAAERHRQDGERFLAENAGQEGVVALPSGLQYKVLEAGEGQAPGPTDRVIVSYRGTRIDGTEFHDSRVRPGKPETLHVSGVIPGLTEALQRMREGARWRVFLPADLAYGRRGPLADYTVIFEIELISIVAGDEKTTEGTSRGRK